jgi:hypothetical protein
MPLALMGFTLQSFPLENSIALSSRTITQYSLYLFFHIRAGEPLQKLNSQTLLLRRIVRPNKYRPYKVLIHFQVRSHHEKV